MTTPPCVLYPSQAVKYLAISCTVTLNTPPIPVSVETFHLRRDRCRALPRASETPPLPFKSVYKSRKCRRLDAETD